MYAKPSLEDGISLAQVLQTLYRNCWLIGVIFAVFTIGKHVEPEE